MNKRVVFFYTGRIMQVMGAILMLPMIVSIIESIKNGKENIFWISFLISAGIAAAVGSLLTFFAKPEQKNLFVKEGFVIVAISWTLMSVIGALPFVISGAIPSFVNALFETVSGFTTTGATILEPEAIEALNSLSKGMMFWRCFTHFIGGMGVLVLVMAILPTEGGKAIHLMRAEMPGPVVGKLVPKVKSTAIILYVIYIVMTLLEAILLFAGGMSLYESVIHAFSTAGTGGFSCWGSSIGHYSPYIQWVIGIFMLLFGINFNLYFLIIIGKVKTAVKSRELWFYFSMITLAAAVISLNIFRTCGSLPDTVRTAFFQVTSFVSSSGFATVDANAWPYLSKAVLVTLMFVGACAGSTGGGLKVSRVMMIFKIIKRDLNKTLHPRQVALVKFEGKKVDDQTISNVSSYFLVYTVTFFLVCFVVTLEKNYDFEAAFTSTVSCLNNIGPFFSASGASTSSYGSFSIVTKLVLTVAMLFGRLEIYPMLFAISPSTWRK